MDAAARLDALDVAIKALAHPARRQILMAIHFRGEPVTAGDIAKRFAHTWPTTTRHLRVLEDAGIITQEQRGKSRLYRMDPTRLRLVREWLNWLESEGEIDKENSPRGLM